MNGKRLTVIMGAVILGALLFVAGVVFAQAEWGDDDGREAGGGTFGQGVGHMFGWDEDETGDAVRQREMMGGYGDMMDPGGTMGGYGDMMDPGGTMGAYGGMMGAAGMMGAYDGMMGTDEMMGPAMMGGWGGLVEVEPLSIQDAEHAVSEFVAELDEDELAIGEIMIFENHAYAQVMDTSSGQGAFEVLVDPVSGNVYPEPGPNIMWNTDYGHMAGGREGMMMGRYGRASGVQDSDQSLDSPEAVEQAQSYLDEYLPGARADEHADAFPGYYTLHVLRDGQIVGMLSVNAYTGAVFPHTWHGEFVEMSDGHHD
ncbi:MAG: hypothetical protein R3300_15240 [Candidatus Promineifilaceae bacterium]|nr:hypothetical protein [Candidatus Promineifilaceae bacterium]